MAVNPSVNNFFDRKRLFVEVNANTNKEKQLGHVETDEYKPECDYCVLCFVWIHYFKSVVQVSKSHEDDGRAAEQEKVSRDVEIQIECLVGYFICF
jgi:hypothetical protein